jgi:8-oxo-dGTP pyrophosphatase MutT (NUDIX family)
VHLPDGRRFWGRFGAAGLLVASPAGVLLQHRAGYSHFGGTWGLPGGARHPDETAVEAACREAEEEAGVPRPALTVRFTSRLELGQWSYTTVGATASSAFPPVIGDGESTELRWVPAAEVDALPLHPGFAAAWPALRDLLEVRPVLLVDGANVVGSRPDGWWQDRAGAAARLLARLELLAAQGVPAGLLGLPQERWWPEVRLVVEGQANALQADGDRIEVVRAPRDGDATIAELASSLGTAATVVTADRGLRDRVTAAGARAVGPGALLDLIDALPG